MRFTADRRTLAAAAKAVIVQPVNLNQAILHGLHIEADRKSGVVTLTSSNLDLTVAADVRADVDNGGVAIVPAARIAEFLNRTTSQLAMFELTEHGLSATAGEAVMVLRCFDVNAWPTTPTIDAPGPNLTAGDIDRIGGVLHATVRDEKERLARPVLAGVHFFSNRVETCSSYGLALAELSVEMPDVVAPVNTMRRVVQGARDEGCTVSTDGRRITFSTGDATWTSTLLAMEYPPGPRSMIRQSSPSSWRFDTDDLLASLDRIALLDASDPSIDAQFGSKKLISHVLMQRDGGKVLLRNAAADLGEIADAVPVDGDFDGPIIFDHRLLASVLKAHDEPTVTFELDGPMKPLQIRSGDSRRVQLLVPVRVKP